jgi:DnaJ-class molecular chaperone
MSFESNEKRVMQNINSDDFYTRLGIRRDATPDEIESSYIALGEKYDPQAGGDPDDYNNLTEAYDSVLQAAKESLAANPGQERVTVVSDKVQEQIDTQKEQMAAAMEKMRAMMKPKE